MIITVIFIINLHGIILLLQLIYGGQNVQSLTKFDFTEVFRVESIKIIKRIIVPQMRFNIYIFPDHTHATLTSLIIFWGQKDAKQQTRKMLLLTQKSNQIKASLFRSHKKLTEGVVVFRFYFFNFFFLSFIYII